MPCRKKKECHAQNSIADNYKTSTYFCKINFSMGSAN